MSFSNTSQQEPAIIWAINKILCREERLVFETDTNNKIVNAGVVKIYPQNNGWTMESVFVNGTQDLEAVYTFFSNEDIYNLRVEKINSKWNLIHDKEPHTKRED